MIVRSDDRRRGERGQRRPEVLLELGRDRSRTSRPSSAATHSAAQARSPASSMRASGCKATGSVDVVGERAAEVVPVAAHGERRGPDRTAEVEGEDLGARDSGGTAAPSAPAARSCPRRSGRRSGCGRHRRHAARSGTASSLPSGRRTAAALRKCSSRSGPAQTAENGIMCARLSVEIGGWRTLA